MFRDCRDRDYKPIKKGARVMVLRAGKYDANVIGKVGTVDYIDYGNVGVVLDTVPNKRSAYGRFYFTSASLVIVDDTNNNFMEECNMQPITNYLNIAKIHYLDNSKPSEYIYANFDPDLAVGDICVVKSAHHGFGLATVTEIRDQTDVELDREIVAKVDTHEYDARVAARKKAAELKAKMEERAKQLQDVALYKMLAETDPAMAELLSEYQNLPKV